MKKIIQTTLGLIISVSLISCMGNIEEQAAKDLKKIENAVALDFEKQYAIAEKSGSDMDAYVAASTVAAAYLQAKDEANYKKWKAVEADWAAKVGL